MGTLTLIKVSEDQEADGERISFNPCRLAPGIEVSNDPILEARWAPMKSRVKCAADVLSSGGKSMPSDEGWLDRFVDWLPTTLLFKCVASWILVPYWARRTPVKPLPGGPHPSFQHGDNVQCMINLIMPLKVKSPIGRAEAALAIAQNKDAIYAGLNNVGTVQFARFVIVGDNIACSPSMTGISPITFVISSRRSAGFNAVVKLVEGGEKVTPCERNAEAFFQWIRAGPVPGAGHRHRVLRDQEA